MRSTHLILFVSAFAVPQPYQVIAILKCFTWEYIGHICVQIELIQITKRWELFNSSILDSQLNELYIIIQNCKKKKTLKWLTFGPPEAFSRWRLVWMQMLTLAWKLIIFDDSTTMAEIWAVYVGRPTTFAELVVANCANHEKTLFRI